MDQIRSHTPVAFIDGKMYIFGGGGLNFTSLNGTAAYDPATDRWENLAPMPTARSGTIACIVDGKVYIIGGGFKKPDGMFQFLRTVEIYDPQKDSWEAGPDMLMPHDYPGGTLMDGHIYILGGHHPDATTSGPKTDPGFEFCERLNLATGQWEEIAPLPTPRFALSAVVYNNRLMTMGGVAFTPEGFNNFTIIEAYDPAANQWSTLSDLSLPWTAAGQGNCVIDDHLFIFGGYSGDGIHNRAAFYDPGTKQWQRLPDMPAPRAAMGVGVNQREIFLLGGWADDGRTPVDSLFSITV
jgi:N-acetylneuraminic acid mutarotase